MGKLIIKSKVLWILVGIFVMGGIFLTIAVKLVNSLDYPNSDFFSFWLAGRMVWTGQDPYSSDQWIAGHHQYNATWISDPEFLYPLPLALFLAPLGLLSLYHAYIAWVALLLSMIFLSVWLLFSTLTFPKQEYLILPVLAGVFLFRPTIITLVNGQLSGGLLLVSVLVITCWEKEKWWQGSILLPLLALKPNLGIPMLVFLSIWLLTRRQIRLLGWVVVSGLILLVAGLLVNPHWVSDYLTIGNAKISQTFGYSPTVWGFAALLADFQQTLTIVFGSLVAIVFFVGCLYLLIKNREWLSPSLVVSLVIATTLLITPYTWPYDQVLLIIPLIVVVKEMVRREYPFLVTASLFILYDLLAIGLLVITARVQLEIINAILPLCAYSLLFLMILTNKASFEDQPFPESTRR